MYLADRRDDMLPAVISADVCSLLSKVDRSVDGFQCLCIMYYIVVLYCFVSYTIYFSLILSFSFSFSFSLFFLPRYAVSVVWKLSPQYEVKEKKVWYGRTIIRSSYKLTYEVIGREDDKEL